MVDRLTLPHPLPRSLVGMLVAALLVVVGSLGPWAHVEVAGETLTLDGLDGGSDGGLTLICALAGAAGAVISWRIGREWRWALMSLTGFAVAAVTGVYDWRDTGTWFATSSRVRVEVGWGLQLVTIAALGGLACAVARLRSNTAIVRAPAQPSGGAGADGLPADS